MKNYKDDIQVSVCVVTYNQEKYIAECLDSLVSQKTNFKFEIIVGEDCSTDSTRNIVQRYIDKYPNLIIPLFHSKNVGYVENIKQVYMAAKGNYIAHMDGDDMALPNKLQQQFNMMEINPQAIICSHNVLDKIDDNLLKNGYWNHPKGEYDFLDLIKKLPFFAHSSKLFRASDFKNFSEILCDKTALDIELHLSQSLRGTIIHLEEVLGIYRVNVGISSAKNNKLNYIMIERVIDIYEKLLIENPKYNKVIRIAYSNYLLTTAYSYGLVESNGSKMRSLTFKSIKTKLYSVKQIIMLHLALTSYLSIPIIKFGSKIRNK